MSTAHKDPVCGMRVDPDHAAAKFVHNGETHYFCAVSCREKFQADPDKYLSGAADHEPMGAGPYTCPMHPHIVQQVFGTCPICGMALEPMTASPVDGPNPELADFSSRLKFAAGFTIPLMGLAMGEMFLKHPLAYSGWIQAALAAPVVCWAGRPLLERGAASVRSGYLNMFTLIGLGVGVAFGYSFLALLFPGLLPHLIAGHSGGPPIYFEAAASIITLVLLGQVLELRARDRTGSAIRSLLKLAPDTARIIRFDGSEQDVPLAQIGPGDKLRILPGRRVPVDGVVLEGAGAIDESALSGESMPVAKKPGDKVVGGTVNGSGSLVMMAHHVGSDTVLARIVRMVAQAQRSRAPVQDLVDKAAAWFVPAVIAAAAISAAAWVSWGPEPRLAHALLAAVSVLIIACPCALGLATPMSIMVAVGRGAQAGILIREAQAIQQMRDIDTLVVDKTGTLTEGKPRMMKVITAERFNEADVLFLAGSLERGSEHPLATAIIAAAAEQQVVTSPPEEFRSFAGVGVTGKVARRAVAVGSRPLLDQLEVAPGDWPVRADELRKLGQTVVYVIADGRVIGLVGIADPIRSTTSAAIKQLTIEGVEVVMLTGDHQDTAAVVAGELGIERYEAQVMPADKLAVVRRLMEQGRRVAMAGDGVNDAPALAAAHVGIAMSSGTDVAIRSAGLTLMTSDLRAILRARKLSAATMANIRQNLLLAFGYNVLAIPVAAGVLYPCFGLLLSPMIAAAAMSLSSVSVIINALRLRRVAL